VYDELYMWVFIFLYKFLSSGSESPRPGSRASFREDILWERRNVSESYLI